MGDLRNYVSFPDPTVLIECYNKYLSYLSKYAKNPDKIKQVVNLLLALSQIRFYHLCNNSRFNLLNNINDKFHVMLDFRPSCTQCNMNSSNHLNLINLRDSLGRSWEKGVLSELYFSKLLTDVASNLDDSIEVYPRLVVEHLPHECDVLLKKNNTIILFELKRSEFVDGYSKKGVTQLNENKEVLQRWGVDCLTVLVTNCSSKANNIDVDVHFNPNDVIDLKSNIENLLF